MLSKKFSGNLGPCFLGTVLISTGPGPSVGTKMPSKKFSGNLGSW